MRTKIKFTVLFSVWLVVGCTSNTDNDRGGGKQSGEEKSLEQKSNSNTISNDGVVGEFSIGHPIPFSQISNDYTVRKEIERRLTEEGPEEEKVYLVGRDGIDMLQLKTENDDKSNIREIIVLSDQFRTDRGIGVHSTMDEFIEQYPEYHIWYTYVSRMYVIETPTIKAQFILDEKDFSGNLEVTSEITTLHKSDFNPDAEIMKVRIF